MSTVVVIGATGGIGSVVVRLTAARGRDLVLAGRSADRLASLQAELASEFPHVRTVIVPCDAVRSSEVDAVFQTAVDKLGPVTGAVNLVGSILLKPAHLTTDEDFLQTVALNLHTAFFTTRAAVRAMTGHGGSIVLASSAAARIGLINHEAIAAAKGGVQGLTIAAAASYANRGIRVNAVAPGLTRTPLASRITANEASLKASASMHPVGRIGEAEEVARAIDFLLDPMNSWITGQILGVDGGLGTVRSR